MDQNITQTVFDLLDARTDEIQEGIKELNKLEAQINAGDYSPEALKNKYCPKRDAMRRKIEADAQHAIDEAKGLIQQYREDAASLNNLNPADLTDDVKLLQAGIVLKENDIVGMLDRNSGNRTMTQIILRYCEQHNIKVDRTYIGGMAEEQTAKTLDTILLYYKNWIREKNAKQMLHEFFGVKPTAKW